MSEVKPTLAQKIPQKYRGWGYAVAATIVPAYFAYDLAYSAPKWMTIPMAVITGSGFYVARSNTP